MGSRASRPQSNNFLELYLRHAGRSEVPAAYHKWACLSLLAALVRDRVWYERFVEIPLTPHIFVFLIGESATGKDIAARFAIKFLKYVPSIRAYQGKTSAAAFIDFMRKRQKTPGGGVGAFDPPDPRVWLITTELANSLGQGGQANAFIKFATDIYSGKDEHVPWRESTRHAGVDKKLAKPLLNWFAGTTRTWLSEVVTMDDIQGGFFARVCPIEVDTSTDHRVYQPSRPTDYDDLRERLYDRVEVYANAEGVFTMDHEAKEIDRHWYENRPAPSDDRLNPTWRRQYEQVLKLAQLYALCDWTSLEEPLVIGKRHIVLAQKDAAVFLKTTKDLMAYSATKNVDAASMLLVANYVKKHGAVRQSNLLKAVYTDGISSEYLHRILQTLLQAKEILFHKPEGAGGRYAGNPTVVWKGGRSMGNEKLPGEDEVVEAEAPAEDRPALRLVHNRDDYDDEDDNGAQEA